MKVEEIYLVPGVTGFIFMLAGLVMRRFPPRKINMWYGYRTPSSMKDQRRWDFAQRYSARELFRLGLLMVIVSVVLLAVGGNSAVSAIVVNGSLIAVVVLLIVRVERAIKKRFGQ